MKPLPPIYAAAIRRIAMGAVVTVDFDALKQNHKKPTEIKPLLTGDIGSAVKKNNWEVCAVNVSYALNHSAAPIEKYDYADKGLATGKVRAKTDDTGKNYIYSVYDMKVYLDNRFGKAENYKGKKAQMIAKITGRTGILAFGYRHIDLWEGNRWHNQDHYLDLWEFDSVKQWGIFFWEVPKAEKNP